MDVSVSSLAHLKAHLRGRVVVLGIGNTLRSDDAAGSLLASRLKGRLPYSVYDAGVAPENYCGVIVREKPDTIILIDAVAFGGAPGAFQVVEAEALTSHNLFATHNTSVGMVINYLRTNCQADIIGLIIQPKQIGFGDSLSEEVAATLTQLEAFLYEAAKETR